MYSGINTSYLKFPTKPQKRLDWMSFPNDLVQDGRNFYTEIAFMDYSVQQQFNETPVYQPSGGLRLPIPRKLNDSTLLTWREQDAVSLGTSLLSSFARGRAAATLARVGGVGSIIGKGAEIGTGYALNPFLFMMFQRPNYKEFTLSWTLAPNTEQESYTISEMINRFKYAALPENHVLVLKYPQIAYIKIYPNDIFGNMIFRPCAIQSVQVDYTGAGSPSFFRNGAPTVVNLNVQLKEIQLWDKTNFSGSYREPPPIISGMPNQLESIGPILMTENGPTFAPGA